MADVKKVQQLTVTTGDKPGMLAEVASVVAEQKINIVMEALRAEISVSELCRKYSINDSLFYKWNKEFLEAGKKRLSGDTTREATSDEVAELRKENERLKVVVADLVLRYDIVKKSLNMLE